MSHASTITVLVLFTPEAAVRLGSDPLAPIQQVIDLQNTILANSGVDAQVVLVGAELLSEFEEQTELGADLDASTAVRILRDSLATDKFGIRRRRDERHADIVSVWVELEPNAPGSASLGLTNTLFQQGSAVAAEVAFLNVVITARAGAPLFHFAHELGHNLGLGHDVGAFTMPASDLIFGFARGFVDTTVPFRTVMAFKDACQNAGFDNCPRIPFYSSASPLIQFNGRPVGHPVIADNARALRTTIPFVASYRQAPFVTGELLSYGDAGTPGNVSDPVVVGFGGWLPFKLLFAGANSGGEARIYAVDQGGQLLSYGDAGTPGNVSDPIVVGFGGWKQFNFLFAGRNAAGENRIYAVDQEGQLLSYGDAGTPGNVSDPIVVGFGGWKQFKFLFAGRNAAGENRIYAVDQDGQLLSYGDAGTPGNVSSPMVVGFGGWLQFKFLFAGRNAAGENRIYAVVA